MKEALSSLKSSVESPLTFLCRSKVRVRTATTKLGSLNVMKIIGFCDGRGQVVALSMLGQVGMVTIMDSIFKAEIRSLICRDLCCCLVNQGILKSEINC